MTLSSQSSNHDLNKPLHLMAHWPNPIKIGNFFNDLLGRLVKVKPSPITMVLGI